MTTDTSPSRPLAADDDLALRAAVAAHLARFTGQSRVHTGSDLRVYLSWCTDRDLGPLAAGRADVERYVRWLQEVRRFKPSTVSRRLAVVCGFYRTCVIDGLLAHSPAEYVRRPSVPPESPTLGLSHLQFEAMLATARASTNPNDFALVAMLGLLGLRIFEATGASISDLGEEHGHRVLRVVGQRHQGRTGAAATGGQPRDRPRHRRPTGGTDPAQPARRPHGPPRRHPPPQATGCRGRGSDAQNAPPHAHTHS